MSQTVTIRKTYRYVSSVTHALWAILHVKYDSDDRFKITAPLGDSGFNIRGKVYILKSIILTRALLGLWIFHRLLGGGGAFEPPPPP